LYETELFPLAFGDYFINEQNELVDWTLHDSREAFEYTVPPLSIMRLRNANAFLPPKYQRFVQLEISYDGHSYILEQETPAEVLSSLNNHLLRYDPDIILSDYGDATLMPMLVTQAKACGVPLMLNRDVQAEYQVSKESSFFQYGKVVHKDGAFELRGRWHLDADNSFTLAESHLDGLIELTRITQLCPQHQARASIGTGLSSLQLSWAYRNRYLIPSKKREPEDFKSAATLLLADRGGLIFQPPPGYHEDIAELDFVSMYPSIMVNNNVSPETVNCRCCRDSCSCRTVPELEYRICEQREGIVPATLRSVVARRSYCKKKKKEFKHNDERQFALYDSRQNALKWMLVCCFGYLGYKNARFGRIEAHESVNAFSRDAILTAKEIAEERGYELLHAIIDCMWLKKPGATEEDYERLCVEISERVGIDISLEGIYKWILFPSSKMDGNMATANRYVGTYRNDELKLRGIESRRRDTCKFIKAMQHRMLECMSSANSVQEIQTMIPSLLCIVEEYVGTIRSGKANPMELVLRRHIHKEADEYTNNSVSAVVTRMLEDAGVHLSAGESIDYIILDHTGKKKPEKAKPLALYAFEDGYDAEKYIELVLDAASTLLEPFGYSVEVLAEKFQVRQVKRRYKQDEIAGSTKREKVFLPSGFGCWFDENKVVQVF
jgi:DNA polymerase-2